MPAAVATKPVLPPLQTPKTASFPSEIVETPVSACISAVVKQEQQSLQTPITPPAAYTDYLKALTPVLASPPPSALSRSISDDSTTSRSSITSMPASVNADVSTADDRKPPRSASSLPPTPFRRSSSGLRRLKIPQSPAYSPSTCGPSPRTGVSSLPPHGSALFSPFSPADWSLDSASRRFCDTPRSACSNPVSVRSVVTRTVTYKRSPPLDPAPKGKRRKTDDSADMPPPSTTSVTAPTVVV